MRTIANTDGLDMKITADSSGAKAELESAKKGIKEMGDAAQTANGSVQKLGSAMETELSDPSEKAAVAVNNVLDVIEKVGASEGFLALDDIGSKFESGFGRIFKSIGSHSLLITNSRRARRSTTWSHWLKKITFQFLTLPNPSRMAKPIGNGCWGSIGSSIESYSEVNDHFSYYS